MSAWTLLSSVAVLVAGIPPLYFALRLRRSDASFTGLALLLASALLTHGLFHALQVLGAPTETTAWAEALSAFLILAFALAYWPLRRRP